jgi:1-acyl-sn-glycerol-3-phosphate acyltransferase
VPAAMIRSLLFNILYFLFVFLCVLFGQLVPRRHIFKFWRFLSCGLDFISQKVAGITYSIENQENIPNVPAIYAIRHESAWETLVLIQLFKEPIFVLKKELLHIPLFGRLARRAESIAVDRENGAHAMITALKSMKKCIDDDHAVIVFPEGTRVAPGECVEIKRGIAFFYKKINCPVVPIIHNSGRFWPRRGFFKKPGNITVRVMKPLEPGLDVDEFMTQLTNVFHSEIKKLRDT